LYSQAIEDVPYGLIEIGSKICFMGVDDGVRIEAGQPLRQLARRVDGPGQVC
jgi:hypothetical protein